MVYVPSFNAVFNHRMAFFFNFRTLRIKAMLVVVGGMENKDEKMDIKR